MIKYKREEFLSNSQHRALVISGFLCACAVIDMLRAEVNMAEVMPDNSFLIPIILFAAVSVFLLLNGLIKARNRQKEAMELRCDYMQKGTLSHGKVTDAGGGYYEKVHYRESHIRRGKSRYFRVWENVWWADIEYFDEIEGTYARHKVKGLNKNGKRHQLVGRDVDIYYLDESLYVNFK